MNICFLSQEYPPETHVGGIGTYTHNMAVMLDRLGHTIHVITSTQDNSETYQNKGVWVHRIKKRKVFPLELQRFSYSYDVAKKVSQINIKFDIVHSSEFANEAFYFSLQKRFPLVTRLATPYYLAEVLDNRSFYGPRRPSLFLNWMEKKQTLYSDGIFSSTSALAKKVSEDWGIHPSRIEIIPNSIDVSRVVKLAKKKSIPDLLLKKDYLLYFGRLEERKGVRVLAKALPAVLEHFPKLYMVFIGSDIGFRDASMRKYINKRTGKHTNRLIYYDNMPQGKLFPIVKSAKIVILPSLWEAFGFVCVEAMALSRPVIATAGSGFEEIIENDISGYLIEPGNSLDLANKIISCLRDEKGLKQISSGAIKRAQDFEVSNVAHKLLTYYEKIIILSHGKAKVS